MNRMRTSRRIRERRLSRALMIAFAVVLALGVCSQIAMMARLSGQNKRVVETQKEIRALSASADNLNLSLNQYHNLERIALRARQLGMEQPDETQLRVVNLPTLIDSTSTQSADNSGAEEIRD
ncbi:MAG: septum formation initiator family protein [Clostridia bacterium]|nr:septum formation initiator family protein [Clostridia bacterium]MBR6890799.1 septum formation initiator family protein [Clostridia bacterium]